MAMILEYILDISDIHHFWGKAIWSCAWKFARRGAICMSSKSTLPSLLQVRLRDVSEQWGSWTSSPHTATIQQLDFSVQLHSPFRISKYWGRLTSRMIPPTEMTSISPKTIHKYTSNANLMPQKQRHFKLEFFFPIPMSMLLFSRFLNDDPRRGSAPLVAEATHEEMAESKAPCNSPSPDPGVLWCHGCITSDPWPNGQMYAFSKPFEQIDPDWPRLTPTIPSIPAITSLISLKKRVVFTSPISERPPWGIRPIQHGAVDFKGPRDPWIWSGSRKIDQSGPVFEAFGRPNRPLRSTP